MAGTLAMAYIGMINNKTAMMGPPNVSIIFKILGLIVATIQQVRIIKISMILCREFLLIVLPVVDFNDLTIIPLKPSLAPK